MAFTPIPIGSLGWGAPANAAWTDQDARISELEVAGTPTPAFLGFKAMPFPPEMAGSGTSLVSGTVYMQRFDLAQAETLTGLTFAVSTAGAGLTAGQNLVGVYDAAGTRLAVSADQSAAWASNDEKNPDFTAPVAVSAGTYYSAVLSVGATPISMFRNVATQVAAQVVSHGLTAANGRWTTGPTAQTSLPASVTMASRTLSGTSFWVGVR